MNNSRIVLALGFLPALSSVCLAASGPLAVKAVNKLPVARPSQTIELSVRQLGALSQNLNLIHVKDASGKELLCQAVDTDYDAKHTPDIVIFQADFAPGETRTFTASAGAKNVYTQADFRAHGRFVRERFDDFAWENDRIAHRMYGKALETWAGEPLTSSAVDIWTKRTPNMVIDEWYMVDNYHTDTGTGADFYSAGATRGDGGSGLWATDKLWVSKNFADSRVLANGPIRVMFELVYEPFDVNGSKVSEVKRITLDAGSNLDRFQSLYKPQSAAGPLVCGIGLKKVAGEQLVFNEKAGWMASWEKVEGNHGMQGLALIVEPKSVVRQTEDPQNNLVLVNAGPDNTVSYWAGFGWDKSGQFSSADEWKGYVDNFARGLRTPIEVTVSP